MKKELSTEEVLATLKEMLSLYGEIVDDLMKELEESKKKYEDLKEEHEKILKSNESLIKGLAELKQNSTIQEPDINRLNEMIQQLQALLNKCENDFGKERNDVPEGGDDSYDEAGSFVKEDITKDSY